MSEWRHIETAPNDGTRVLVYRPTATSLKRKIGIDERTPDKFDGAWGHSRLGEQPTHWMPLPEPPSAPEEPAMTDAEWLRERPDLVNAWFKLYEEADSFTAFAVILPLIRAEIVAELAGGARSFSDVLYDYAKWQSGMFGKEPVDLNYEVQRLCAAAHVQGYERAREDAKKIADLLDDHQDDPWSSACQAISEQIAELKP